MSEDVLRESTLDEDVLREKIKQYKEMLKQEKPDLDMELLLRVFSLVNEESEVKVALEPIGDEGEWVSSATTYAVSGVRELDDGRIALRVNDEKHGIAVGKLEPQLRKAFRHKTPYKAPVFFMHKNEEVKLTEVYSHALVRQVYAGLPSDVILATKKEKV